MENQRFCVLFGLFLYRFALVFDSFWWWCVLIMTILEVRFGPVPKRSKTIVCAIVFGMIIFHLGSQHSEMLVFSLLYKCLRKPSKTLWGVAIDGCLALLYKVQIGNPREIVQKHLFFHAFCAVPFLLHFRGCEYRVRVQKSPRSARLPSKFSKL